MQLLEKYKTIGPFSRRILSRDFEENLRRVIP